MFTDGVSLSLSPERRYRLNVALVEDMIYYYGYDTDDYMS